MQNNQAVVSFKSSGVETNSSMILEKSADTVNFSAVEKVTVLMPTTAIKTKTFKAKRSTV